MELPELCSHLQPNFWNLNNRDNSLLSDELSDDAFFSEVPSILWFMVPLALLSYSQVHCLGEEIKCISGMDSFFSILPFRVVAHA